MDADVDTTRVCGVDGCRAGWVVATAVGCRVVARLDDIVGRFDIIGIDMPIGLPESGPRASDTLARRFLSPRGSTVFDTPPRSLLHHVVYAEANAESKQRFGRGLSRQAFALFPKIREVDALARHRPDLFVEIHPECAFTRLAGAVLPPKRSATGRTDRLRLVESVFGPVDTRLRGAGADDVLDAYAVLWSAQRFARGEHVVFGDGTVDGVGLPMRIVS